MPTAWTSEEVEACISSYFELLECEIKGISYNKAQRHRDLAKILSDRTPKSIEYKHRNISAVLRTLGFAFINGYTPLDNYQSLLHERVLKRLSASQALLELAEGELAERPMISDPHDILGCLRPPPKSRIMEHVSEVANRDYRSAKGRLIDYLAREAKNREIGMVGEEFVVRFEQARLAAEGRPDLSSQIEHVSRTRGDGFGFDVLSFDGAGRDRLIEVKTTRNGADTPFYLTSNEVNISKQMRDIYYLYRVYDVRTTHKLFVLQGSISETCTIKPVAFLGNCR